MDDGKTERPAGVGQDLKSQIEYLHSKFDELIEQRNELEGLFGGKEPERNYAAHAKPPTVPARLIRVGTPVASDHSDGTCP